MGPRTSEIANSLSQKYQALHDAFNELANEATRFQNSVDIKDANGRGLFNSLSRIVAFADHVHVAMNLMGEDVAAIEACYGDPMSAGWSEMEACFDEWFASLSVSNAKVH